MILLLLFVLAFANTGYSETEDHGGDIDLAELNEEPIFVSLGSTCGPAFLLRTAGLRRAAFPFDWLLSVDSEKLIEILDEDFLNYTHEDYLVPENYLLPFSDGGALFHIGYHLEFLHDGDWKGLEYIRSMEIFKSKYDRRIERFRSLRTYKGKAFFIRTSWPDGYHPGRYFKCEENNEISELYAFRLSSALRKFFPKLDFTLIVINFDPFFSNEVLVERKLPDGSIEIRLAFADFLEAIQKFFCRLDLEARAS